jgi:hypothetical protein
MRQTFPNSEEFPILFGQRWGQTPKGILSTAEKYVSIGNEDQKKS